MSQTCLSIYSEVAGMGEEAVKSIRIREEAMIDPRNIIHEFSIGDIMDVFYFKCFVQ